MLLAGCVKQLAFQSTCKHVNQISMFTAVRKRIPDLMHSDTETFSDNWDDE